MTLRFITGESRMTSGNRRSFDYKVIPEAASTVRTNSLMA